MQEFICLMLVSGSKCVRLQLCSGCESLALALQPRAGRGASTATSRGRRRRLSDTNKCILKFYLRPQNLEDLGLWRVWDKSIHQREVEDRSVSPLMVWGVIRTFKTHTCGSFQCETQHRCRTCVSVLLSDCTLCWTLIDCSNHSFVSIHKHWTVFSPLKVLLSLN